MDISNCSFTYTGQYVNLVDPQLDTINITDIAKSLSQQNRFAGHTRVTYNVAQHSLIVSDLVPKEFALYGLLHDAEETYFCDVIYPVKYLPQVMSGYRDYAALMRSKIYERFGLAVIPSDACRAAVNQADLIALATERRDLMHPDSQPWPILYEVVPMNTRIRPLSSIAAESMFLTRFKQLTGTL